MKGSEEGASRLALKGDMPRSTPPAGDHRHPANKTASLAILPGGSPPTARPPFLRTHTDNVTFRRSKAPPHNTRYNQRRCRQGFFSRPRAVSSPPARDRVPPGRKFLLPQAKKFSPSMPRPRAGSPNVKRRRSPFYSSSGVNRNYVHYATLLIST